MKVKSLGPSPSDFKEGSGITGMPIWAEYGATPEVQLAREEEPVSRKFHKATKETLVDEEADCRMGRDISKCD